MNDVFVTCIKNGRCDQFGRPLESGASYTLSWSLARDLWLSGYVSVTDAAVFDSSSVDVRRPNLAAELAAIGVYSEPTAAPMGGPGAGMGVCNPAYVPAGLVGLSGYTDKMHDNFGNYIKILVQVGDWSKRPCCQSVLYCAARASAARFSCRQWLRR